MTRYRLNRLFHPVSGRCFDVAIDHGFFNEAAFLAGIEDIARAVGVVAAAGPDAVQLTVGQARHLQELPGRLKPSLVLRVDVANVYGTQLPRRLYSCVIGKAIEQAVRLDAACVCVNLFQIPGEPEVGEQCVENILRLKPASVRHGMPLMVEPLVFRPNAEAGGYQVDGDEKKIIPLVRQAVELGADVVKADPTDPVASYHRVIEAAGGVPVLVRGGGRVSDREILQRTQELLAQGASGIVYGRNIIQHPHPDRITRALMAVVHEGLSASDALAKYDPSPSSA
jgi:DhnA family fructose-bisphosphate aldolase class Ia